MKKFIVTFINFILFSSIIFSSEVTDLLENAKTAYSNGNLTETINLIDSAKRVVERETINSIISLRFRHGGEKTTNLC